jgi:hypothetical protein
MIEVLNHHLFNIFYLICLILIKLYVPIHVLWTFLYYIQCVIGHLKKRLLRQNKTLTLYNIEGSMITAVWTHLRMILNSIMKYQLNIKALRNIILDVLSHEYNTWLFIYFKPPLGHFNCMYKLLELARRLALCI